MSWYIIVGILVQFSILVTRIFIKRSLKDVKLHSVKEWVAAISGIAIWCAVNVVSWPRAAIDEAMGLRDWFFDEEV